MEPAPGEITSLLRLWSDGDRGALDVLTPLVYRELHKIASRHLRREHEQPTLQPTALINEAYLRMVDQSVHCNSRAHFFGIAARLMRQILVDCARRRNAAQRGGGAVHVPLDAGQLTSPPNNPTWILELDRALNRLDALDPRKARAVELRHFAGMTLEETASALSVSLATVKRDLLMAETWLKTELHQQMAG